jgi:WD40 repeat protein
VKSGNLEKYYQLLTDFKFLEAKINHPEFGVQGLIEDYDLVNELTQPPLVRGECVSLSPEKIKILTLIQGALRLSAHVLAEDKTQLVEQLWGRLQWFEVQEIQAMLEVAKQRKTNWLRLLIPSLTTPGGRLRRTFTGHSDSVNAVAITPDGKQVISGSRDNTLKIWNLDTAEELFTLTGHSNLVRAIAVTPNGKWVISGSEDNTLKIWNLDTAEELFTLTGHRDSIYSVAITPDGKRVISGSRDNTLKIWDLSSGKVMASFTGESRLYCCAVAPDGLTIVAGERTGRLHFLHLEGTEAQP